MSEATATMAVAKPRRGRKPARESRSREIRQRVAEWKLTPARERRPLTELAAGLGISHQLASYYASQVPEPVHILTEAEYQEAIAALIPKARRVIEELRGRAVSPADRKRLRLAKRLLRGLGRKQGLS